MATQADQMAAALQGPANPTMQGLFGAQPQQLQQMAGDVVRPPVMGFIGANSMDEYLNSLGNTLQQPSGAAAIKSMGGLNAKPPNVIPISPAVQQKMGATQVPVQVAENTNWQDQPLRDFNGRYIGPADTLPIATGGVAQYRNALRSMGIKPTDYHGKIKLTPVPGD